MGFYSDSDKDTYTARIAKDIITKYYGNEVRKKGQLKLEDFMIFASATVLAILATIALGRRRREYG